MGITKSSIEFDSWADQKYSALDSTIHLLALIFFGFTELILLSNIMNGKFSVSGISGFLIISIILAWLAFLVAKRDMPKKLFPPSWKPRLKKDASMQESNILIVSRFKGNVNDESYYAERNTVGEILSLAEDEKKQEEND